MRTAIHPAPDVLDAQYAAIADALDYVADNTPGCVPPTTLRIVRRGTDAAKRLMHAVLFGDGDVEKESAWHK